MRSTDLLFAPVSEVLCGVLSSWPAIAAAAGAESTGMVWEKHGDWHLNGSSTELRLGEAIPPGGLVTRKWKIRRTRFYFCCRTDSGCSANARSENVFSGFPRSRDHSAAPARGLGHVCRGQERLLLRPATARPLSPPRPAAPRWRSTLRWWRPLAHRARSRSLRR